MNIESYRAVTTAMIDRLARADMSPAACRATAANAAANVNALCDALVAVEALCNAARAAVQEGIQEQRHMMEIGRAYKAERDSALAAGQALADATDRWLDLEASCEYVDGEPAVCPGIAAIGSECHWCEARAALIAWEARDA